MEEEATPDLDHYLAALRRWWWILAGSVLLGALLGAVVLGGTGSSYEQTRKLDVRTNAVAVEAAGLSTEALKESLSVASQAEAVDDVAVGSAAVSASGTEQTQEITVTASGPDETDVADASETAVQQVLDLRAQQIGTSVAGAVQATDTAIEGIQQRLDELDTQLAAAGAAGQVATALTVERSGLVLRQSELLERRAALQAVSDTANDNVIVTGDTEPVSVAGRSRATGAVLGGLAGLLLGLVGVLFAAAADRKVRSRSDLARLGVSEVLALVPDEPAATTPGVVALATAIRERVKPPRPHAVLVTAVDGRADVAALCSALRPALQGVGVPPDTVVEAAPLSSSSDALVRAPDTTLAVVLAEANETRAEDLVEALRALEGAGADRVGVALTGVSRRDRRTAAR